MNIFLGKGGSGKTTLSTSFIKFLENRDEKVLATRCWYKCTPRTKPKYGNAKYLGDDFEKGISKIFRKEIK